MRVTSLPVSRPKSSSPASGGMRLKPARRRNTVSRAEHQVQVLGVRNQRQEDQQRQRVQPPVDMPGGGLFAVPPARQVGHHQAKIRNAMTPDSGDTSPSQRGRTTKRRTKSPAMRHRHRHGPHRHEAEIEPAESRRSRRQERQAEARGDVVDRDQRERAEAPEDEGVRQARQRPLPDHLPLQHHFPQELADARAERRDLEIRRFARADRMIFRTFAEPPPEQRQRGNQDHGEAPPVPPTMRRSCRFSFDCNMAGDAPDSA